MKSSNWLSYLLILATSTTRIFCFVITQKNPSTRTSSSSSLFLASNANELFPMKRGATVALVTPFDKFTGAVNYDELRRLLQRQVEGRVENLCILGTTGEASVLSPEERVRILSIAVEEAKGKMTILAGTGTIDPKRVKELTLQARDLGCDAALVVTPYYVKPPQRALIQHFTTIADEGTLPILVYNVPGRTGCNIMDSTLAILAQHDNIIGVKDATGDLNRLDNLKLELQKANVQKPFLCYSGDDATTMEYILRGGDGCISVTCNVAPAIMQQMVQAALLNDRGLASKLNESLECLHKDLFCESNPIPTKYALARMNVIAHDYCRPPLVSLDPALYAKVEHALSKMQGY